MANILKTEKKVMVVSMLAEGNSIRMTPAMAAGVEKSHWTVAELVERCGE
jgi:hypothetical protein